MDEKFVFKADSSGCSSCLSMSIVKVITKVHDKPSFEELDKTERKRPMTYVRLPKEEIEPRPTESDEKEELKDTSEQV